MGDPLYIGTGCIEGRLFRIYKHLYMTKTIIKEYAKFQKKYLYKLLKELYTQGTPCIKPFIASKA